MPSLCSRVVIGGVGMISKAFLNAFTHLKVTNLEGLVECIEARPKGTPLITVANHLSVVDDPLIWGILPWRILMRPELIRWSLGAEEIIHTNFMDRTFFGCGRVLPIRRGAGIEQPIMDAALELLNQGEWLHIFPEGKVIQQPKTMGRLKWGVARLIEESSAPPLILPIMHRGLEQVKPLAGSIKLFRPVEITIGRPVNTTKFIDVVRAANLGCSMERRRKLTEMVRLEMLKYL